MALIRSLQLSLPSLLHRAGAAFTTSTSLRDLEELIVLPPNEDAKPPTSGTRGVWVTGAAAAGGGAGGRRLARRGCTSERPRMMDMPLPMRCRAGLGSGRPA